MTSLLLSSVTVDQGVTAGISVGWTIFGIVVYILWAIALWRTFTKAGYPGILGIIPIVNLFVLVKIAGFSAWWGLLYFIPIAGLILHILIAVRVGRAFGKGTAWSVFLLWLFQVIGFLILGFGSATYTKPRPSVV